MLEMGTKADQGMSWKEEELIIEVVWGLSLMALRDNCLGCIWGGHLYVVSGIERMNSRFLVSVGFLSVLSQVKALAVLDGCRSYDERDGPSHIGYRGCCYHSDRYKNI